MSYADKIDRSEVSRSLAKAIAYHECGQAQKAEAWARLLVTQLKQAQILDDCDSFE
jgi:hypothetical protein